MANEMEKSTSATDKAGSSNTQFASTTSLLKDDKHAVAAVYVFKPVVSYLSYFVLTLPILVIILSYFDESSDKNRLVLLLSMIFALLLYAAVWPTRYVIICDEKGGVALRIDTMIPNLAYKFDNVKSAHRIGGLRSEFISPSLHRIKFATSLTSNRIIVERDAGHVSLWWTEVLVSPIDAEGLLSAVNGSSKS